MTTVRYLCLAVPVGLLLFAARAERDRRGRAAALLAFLAAGVGLAGLSEVARYADWWGFAPVDGAFRGVPVDLWLGWAVLWGPLPVLLRRTLPVPVVLVVMLWLDAAVMPALHPLVRLGPGWLLGDLIGLLAVALPAQLLGRWTADERHLPARAAGQVVVFTAVLLRLVPTAAFEYGDGSWARIGRLPLPWLVGLAQVAGLLAVPGLQAVYEFAVRGGGTPYPWDPPVRLVTTGPYAYLANPMQVSAVALLGLLAAVAGSVSLAAAAVSAVAFSTSVAGPHEYDQLADRHGEQWHVYRTRVRTWWPRWRPYPGSSTAVLWLDLDCGACAAVAGFLRCRSSRHLTVAAAADHHQPLRRARYVSDGGHDERGVAAVTRAMEHLHLGWAYLGWILRVPGIGWLAQLVTDAMIAAPHPTTRTAATQGEQCPPTPSSACSTEPCGPSANTASPASRPAPSPPPPG